MGKSKIALIKLLDAKEKEKAQLIFMISKLNHAISCHTNNGAFDSEEANIMSVELEKLNKKLSAIDKIISESRENIKKIEALTKEFNALYNKTKADLNKEV